MTLPSLRFGFFLAPSSCRGERVSSYSFPSADSPGLPWLELRGLSFLSLVSSGPRVTSEPPVDGVGPLFIIEPISAGPRSHLLLASPSGRRARVNGLPSPRVALLDVKDQLQIDDVDHVLHVSMFCQPFIGPAPDTSVGKVCNVCLTPLVQGQRLFLCPWCLNGLHCEEPAPGGAPGLECARLSSACPTCHEPLRWEPGFVFFPEV